MIYGLWGVFVLLPLFLQPVADFLAKYLGFIPIFKGPASGLSYFGAGIILAIMITPIITSLTPRGLPHRPHRRPARRLRAGRHPLGDDPGGGAAAQPGGHRRRDHARSGPGARARPSPWPC